MTTHTNKSNQPEVTHDEGGGSLWGHLRTSIAATIILTIICCGLYPLVIYLIAQAAFPGQANGSLVKKDGTSTTVDAEAVGSALLGQNFPGAHYFHTRPSAAGAGYDGTSSSGSNLGPLSDKFINGVVVAATTQPTTQPASLAFDGVRLRVLHYALDNSITFKLYSVRSDGTGTKTEVPLSKYQDKDGNLDDVALVDAFPHPPTDTPDRMTLVAGDFSTLIPGDAVTASGSGMDPHISPRNAELQKARVAKTRNINPDAVQKLIDQYTNRPSLGLLGDPGVNVLLLNLALDKAAPIALPATAPAK